MLKFFGCVQSLLPNQLINYGDYFLVDVLGNDLSVVKLTKKRYKMPNGKVKQCKFVKTIIKDCWKQYGHPLNGYWIIPNFLIDRRDGNE